MSHTLSIIRWLLFVIAWQHAMTMGARASDFWDAVRNPPKTPYYGDLRKAEAALRQDMPDAAYRFATRAATRLPALPDAFRLAGRALIKLGRLEDACEAFEQALHNDPEALDDPTMAAIAGHVAMRIGRCALAARILERTTKSLAAGEARRYAYGRLADALMCQGPKQLSAALHAFRLALAGARDDEVGLALGAALAERRAGEPSDPLQGLRGLRVSGRMERALRDRALPEPERLARVALGLEAIGDQEGAAATWAAAAAIPSPWQTFHRAQRERRP